jgi:hypothetical protein
VDVPASLRIDPEFFWPNYFGSIAGVKTGDPIERLVVIA